MRVIGIGPGGARQITLQAIDAMADVDVFVMLDKGSVKDGLLQARRGILDRHAPGRRAVSYTHLTLPTSEIV